LQFKATRQKRKTTRDKQKEQTQQRVLEAARRLFSEKGFFETRASDIAKAAGVAHGTVFSVYGSKAGLITAISDQIMQERIALTERVIAESQANGLSEAEVFLTTLRAIWDEYRESRLVRTYQAYSWIWDSETEAVHARLQLELFSRFRLFFEGKNPDLPVDVETRMWIVSTAMLDAIRRARHGDPEAAWRRVLSAAGLFVPLGDAASAPAADPRETDAPSAG